MLFVRPQAISAIPSLWHDLEALLRGPLFRMYLQPSPLIFHYTSLQAFEAILADGKFRMSHFRHLNDSTEMMYGRKAVNDLLKVETRHRDATSEFFDYCRFFFNDVDDNAIQYFVSSFSSLRDSDELWSRYGCKGNGVAIGFETRRMEAEPSDPSSFFVARVSYTPAQQTDLLLPLISAAKKVLSSYIARFGYDVCDVAVQMFAAKLCSHLNHHSISLKSESWSVEHEWRTVFPLLRNDPDERKNRVSARSDGRPYVDVPVQSAEPGSVRMPIVEVIAGCDTDAQAIRYTLDDLGYRGVTVSRSAITTADIALIDERP